MLVNAFGTNSLLVMGQVPALVFIWCFIVFLWISRISQSYIRCSDDWAPPLQGHIGLSINLNPCRYDFVFPWTQTIAVNSDVNVFSILVSVLLSGRKICIALLCRCFPIVSATLWALPSLVHLILGCFFGEFVCQLITFDSSMCLHPSEVDRPVLHHEFSNLVSYF